MSTIGFYWPTKSRILFLAVSCQILISRSKYLRGLKRRYQEANVRRGRGNPAEL